MPRFFCGVSASCSPCEHVAIERRAAGDQRALEGGDGLHHAIECRVAAGFGKRGREGGCDSRGPRRSAAPPRPRGLSCPSRPGCSLSSGSSICASSERTSRLRPAVARVVGDVHQRHGVVRVAAAGGAARKGAAVRERARRLVAARAAVLAGDRQPRLEKEAPAERDLRLRHRVVRRHRGHGKAARQMPVVVPSSSAGAGERE